MWEAMPISDEQREERDQHLALPLLLSEEAAFDERWVRFLRNWVCMPNCSVSGTKASLQTWGGTRPGDPVADCLFAVTLACMQKSLRRKIASKCLETVFKVDPTNLLCPTFSGEVPFVGPDTLQLGMHTQSRRNI